MRSLIVLAVVLSATCVWCAPAPPPSAAAAAPDQGQPAVPPSAVPAAQEGVVQGSLFELLPDVVGHIQSTGMTIADFEAVALAPTPRSVTPQVPPVPTLDDVLNRALDPADAPTIVPANTPTAAQAGSVSSGALHPVLDYASLGVATLVTPVYFVYDSLRAAIDRAVVLARQLNAYAYALGCSAVALVFRTRARLVASAAAISAWVRARFSAAYAWAVGGWATLVAFIRAFRFSNAWNELKRLHDESYDYFPGIAYSDREAYHDAVSKIYHLSRRHIADTTNAVANTRHVEIHDHTIVITHGPASMFSVCPILDIPGVTNKYICTDTRRVHVHSPYPCGRPVDMLATALNIMLSPSVPFTPADTLVATLASGITALAYDGLPAGAKKGADHALAQITGGRSRAPTGTAYISGRVKSSPTLAAYFSSAANYVAVSGDADIVNAWNKLGVCPVACADGRHFVPDSTHTMHDAPFGLAVYIAFCWCFKAASQATLEGKYSKAGKAIADKIDLGNPKVGHMLRAFFLRIPGPGAAKLIEALDKEIADATGGGVSGSGTLEAKGTKKRNRVFKMIFGSLVRAGFKVKTSGSAGKATDDDDQDQDYYQFDGAFDFDADPRYGAARYNYEDARDDFMDAAYADEQLRQFFFDHGEGGGETTAKMEEDFRKQFGKIFDDAVAGRGPWRKKAANSSLYSALEAHVLPSTTTTSASTPTFRATFNEARALACVVRHDKLPRLMIPLDLLLPEAESAGDLSTVVSRFTLTKRTIIVYTPEQQVPVAVDPAECDLYHARLSQYVVGAVFAPLPSSLLRYAQDCLPTGVRKINSPTPAICWDEKVGRAAFVSGHDATLHNVVVNTTPGDCGMPVVIDNHVIAMHVGSLSTMIFNTQYPKNLALQFTEKHVPAIAPASVFEVGVIEHSPVLEADATNNLTLTYVPTSTAVQPARGSRDKFHPLYRTDDYPHARSPKQVKADDGAACISPDGKYYKHSDDTALGIHEELQAATKGHVNAEKLQQAVGAIKNIFNAIRAYAATRNFVPLPQGWLDDQNTRYALWYTAAMKVCGHGTAACLPKTLGVQAKTRAEMLWQLVLNNKINALLQRVDSVYLDSRTDPTRSAGTPIYMYVKKEALTEGKINRGRSRTIKSPPLEHAIIQYALTSYYPKDCAAPSLPTISSYAYGYVSGKATASCIPYAGHNILSIDEMCALIGTSRHGDISFPFALGMDAGCAAQNWSKRTRAANQLYVAGDVSAWDKTIPYELMEASFVHASPAGAANTAKYLCNACNRAGRIVIDGWSFPMTSPSWCSGNRGTLTFNTIMHLAMLRVSRLPDCILMGDDSVIAVDPNVYTEKTLPDAYAQFGLTLKQVDSSRDRFEFCGYIVHVPSNKLAVNADKMAGRANVYAGAEEMWAQLSRMPVDKIIISKKMLATAPSFFQVTSLVHVADGSDPFATAPTPSADQAAAPAASATSAAAVAKANPPVSVAPTTVAASKGDSAAAGVSAPAARQ